MVNEWLPRCRSFWLAGDFLLARASVSLAALRNSETVELMSQVLENLVTGEIMQVGAVGEWVTAD